jgi:predicted ATP-dependent serine protease
MKMNTPCVRHSHVWMARCPDCTAWHLPREIARRTAADARTPRPPVRSSTSPSPVSPSPVSARHRVS